MTIILEDVQPGADLTVKVGPRGGVYVTNASRNDAIQIGPLRDEVERSVFIDPKSAGLHAVTACRSGLGVLLEAAGVTLDALKRAVEIPKA